jgi:hypothetical protein
MSSVQQVATSSVGIVQRINYDNSEAMSAIIAPTGAVSVVLQFVTFNTELNYDKVTVKRCTAIGCSQTSDLGSYSGTTIPSPVTSNTGIMLIQWTSDVSGKSPGWSARWIGITGMHCNLQYTIALNCVHLLESGHLVHNINGLIYTKLTTRFSKYPVMHG